MEKHKLKNENEDLKYQISELNKKLDIILFFSCKLFLLNL